jgi:hypothetical protein
MNDEAAHPGRPATYTDTAADDSKECGVSLREAVVVALEALEVGDNSHAADVLLHALEDGPAPAKVYRCACGDTFEWPGLRDRHSISCLKAAA